MQQPIDKPNDNDVLCGRGGYINSHPGNELFRKLVERRKRVYLAARFKREKRLVANSIVSEIRALEGRFLAKESKTGRWYDIGDEKARDKTSQALRENAPNIRAEIKDGMDQRRNQKPTTETSKSKLKSTSSTKSEETAKKDVSTPDKKSSQQAQAPPPYWNPATSHYPQPPSNYYPPYNGYGQQCPPPPTPYAQGRLPHAATPQVQPPVQNTPPPAGHHIQPQGQWSMNPPQQEHRPNHQGSSMVATSPFSHQHNVPLTTDHIQSSTATSNRAPWQENNSSNLNSTADAMNHIAVQPHVANPDSQTRNQHDASHGRQQGKHPEILSNGGNNMRGSWEYPIFPQESMEEEIGQEVELVEMDYQIEDHRPISNMNKIKQLQDSENRMAPPPIRPKQKEEKSIFDWTSKLSCQSSWLPIPDSFSVAGTHQLSPSTSYDMDVSAVGTEAGISLAASSIGGASLCQVFDQDTATVHTSLSRTQTGSMGGASYFDHDTAAFSSLSRAHTGSMGGNSLTQVFDQDTSTSESLSKAHSLISSAHSMNSTSSMHSLKAPSFDEHCRSPSFSERSFTSKSSALDCQMSPVPTTSAAIASLGSKSTGSRSYRRKVAPLEGGFH